MYNLRMNLQTSKIKPYYCLERVEPFSEEEFFSQLQFHKITALKEVSEKTALILEGRMMSPYEQNLSDALYEQKI